MSLRKKVLKGGFYMSFRHGVSMAISIIGFIFLTRVIGPENYGLYAAVIGIYGFINSFGQFGIGIYLIRKESFENDSIDDDTAFTMLFCSGVMFACISILFLPLIAKWIKIEGYLSYAPYIFIGLPVSYISIVPLARIERLLDYKRIAAIDLTVQVIFYLFSIPLAFFGIGAWALTYGWWAQKISYLIILYVISGYRPSWSFDINSAKRIIKYGFGYSSSIGIWQLRSLVNPLVVGRYAGVKFVGYIALSIRFVEILSFVKSATWRVSIAALAKRQMERAKMAKAITEGMKLQVLSLGFFLILFSVMSPLIIKIFIGDQWISALEVFPFIATAYLVNAMFNLHSSALYVIQKNWEVAVFHLFHMIIFVVIAMIAVPYIGFVGYGWAEIIAIFSYIIIHKYTKLYIGAPQYSIAFVWVFGFSISLFWNQIGIWSLLGTVAILLWPKTRIVFYEYFRSFKDFRHE